MRILVVEVYGVEGVWWPMHVFPRWTREEAREWAKLRPEKARVCAYERVENSK